MIERLGVAKSIEVIGIQRVIDTVGIGQVLAVCGEEKLLAEMLRHRTPEQLKAAIEKLQRPS